MGVHPGSSSAWVKRSWDYMAHIYSGKRQLLDFYFIPKPCAPKPLVGYPWHRLVQPGPSQNLRIVWVGRDLSRSTLPNHLQWPGTPSATSGWSVSCPTCSWMFPGVRHPLYLWENSSLCLDHQEAEIAIIFLTHWRKKGSYFPYKCIMIRFFSVGKMKSLAVPVWVRWNLSGLHPKRLP